MKDLSLEDNCDKLGEDYINYYLSKYDNFYLYFTGTFCHNCKDIIGLLNTIDYDRGYLPLVVDNNETDEYMDYLEKTIGQIKVPTLLYINNGKIERKCIGEEKCKEELYNCDNNDDF